MKSSEMAVKKGKKNDKTKAEETAKSELSESRWSVVTFDQLAAKNLTYKQAEQKLRELAAEKIAGLCIVTDEAAEKINSTATS